MALLGLIVTFFDIPFCITKLGNKTNFPVFKFVAGVNREFIWELTFCLCNSFFCYFLINFFMFFFISV